MYYTQNFEDTKQSVIKLAALNPQRVITGHGQVMEGKGLQEALNTLARNFDQVAVPIHGKYLEQPANAEDGSAYEAA
jgi:hypothetical protein